MGNSLRKNRDEIGDLFRGKRFEEAIRLLSAIEPDRPLGASELVSKGCAIMLAPEGAGFPLAAAEAAFKDALVLNPEYADALVELAWYYHTVEDDSRRALPLFEQAVRVCRQQLTAAARGYASCLAELESPERAATSLRIIHEAALLIEDLPEEEQRWLHNEGD